MNRYRHGVLSLGIFAIVFIVGCVSAYGADKANSQSGSIFEYFPHAPGWSLAYNCTSQNDPNESGKRWITFQNPAIEGELSFHYMEANTGDDANGLWRISGDIIGSSNSRDNTYYDREFRYFLLMNMPSQYENGMDYTNQDTDFNFQYITYHLSTGNSWMNYSDCIKITFESDDNFGPPWEHPLLGGSGYFYLAKDVGLVFFLFQNRNSKNVEMFSLAEPPKQLEKRRIYGHIQDSGGTPLRDVYVSIHDWLGKKWWGKTDTAGDFSFDFYYENGMVQSGIGIGYDSNNDGILDDGAPPIAWGRFKFGNEDLNMGTIPYSPKKIFASTSTPRPGVNYLSDMQWTDCRNGYGPAERDTSNGEYAYGDGKPITLNGTTYAKGLGCHAPSEIRYDLGGRYSRFVSDVGVDDEVGANGTITFEVWLDGTKAFDSGVMNGGTATKNINLNVAGKNELKLTVTNGGDNINSDHADWAGAYIFSGAGTK